MPTSMYTVQYIADNGLRTERYPTGTFLGISGTNQRVSGPVQSLLEKFKNMLLMKFDGILDKSTMIFATDKVPSDDGAITETGRDGWTEGTDDEGRSNNGRFYRFYVTGLYDVSDTFEINEGEIHLMTFPLPAACDMVRQYEEKKLAVESVFDKNNVPTDVRRKILGMGRRTRSKKRRTTKKNRSRRTNSRGRRS